MSLVRLLSNVLIRLFWKIPSLVRYVVVAMVIVINSVTGGFS